MTCREVNQYLDRNSGVDWAGLPEQLRKHMENCEGCRMLWELLSHQPCPRQVPQQVRSRIENEVLGSLEPVAPLAGTGRLTLGFALIFGGWTVLFVGLLASPAAPGVNSLPFAAVAAFASVVGLVVSLALSREMIPGEKRYVSPTVAHSLALLALFGVVALAFPWRINEPFLAEAWECFRAGFLISLPAAALAVLLLRRGAPLSPETVGAGSGLLAGLVGVLTLHFSCPIVAAPHIALGHVMVPVALVLIGHTAGKLLPVRWSAGEAAGPTPSSEAR
jgi:hypothetical protein